MKLRTLLFLVGMNPCRKRETCRVHRLNSDRAGRSPKLLSELSTRSYLKQLEHLANTPLRVKLFQTKLLSRLSSPVLLCKFTKGLFTWGGGPRSSGVGFFCFHALEDTKQKKPTPLDRVPPFHVNRV